MSPKVLTFGQPPIWRGSSWMVPIPDQPGLYASRAGHIWSTRGGEWKRLSTRRGGFKKGDERRGGYLMVSFRDRRTRPQACRKVSVHVLVCTAWHGPKPTPNHTVDHINHNHMDNRPCNLRWLHKDLNVPGGVLTEADWEDILEA